MFPDTDYEFDDDFTDAYDEEDALDFEEDDIRELGSDPLDWGDGIARDEEDGWFYGDDDQDEFREEDGYFYDDE
ncbi:hypothetical protein [Suttonella ornithocola]|uniref:Uncharacterized protein n=1 Tax=Suttonella ornithocola TaxID=279832 RepID=A0A380MZI9_9GAMM|nr:hypothetical protein [Suttonella ornithocola]SUO97678.1 Uncharacterised protein [Suttonella ornithocola]